MKMYIANGTRQVIDFAVRLPGVVGPPKSHRIPIGKQIVLPYDLDQKEVDYLIENNAMYGLVDAKSIDQTRPFIGMCFSIDKPVPAPKVHAVMDHNLELLQERGRENRKMAAIAANNILDNAMHENKGLGELTGMEMTITEEDNKNRDSNADLLQETFNVNDSVTRDQHGKVTTGDKRRRSGGKNR